MAGAEVTDSGVSDNGEQGPAGTVGDGSTAEATVVVRNRNGLHARPSSVLAETALRFEGTRISLRRGAITVDAKSIMELLLLEAGHGTELVLLADGPRAREAVDELGRLFEREFDLDL